MDAKSPFKNRYNIYRKIPKLTESIRGSLVIMKRACGKDNCRCNKGLKHKAVYLSQRYKGRTRMIYIPRSGEKRVSKYIKNYQKTKNLLDKISDINIELVTKRKLEDNS